MMRASRRPAAGLAAMLLLAVPIAAHGQGTPATLPSPEALLRQMSDALDAAKTFEFHAEVSFDDVLVSGQKLRYAGAVDVTVKRPDGVYIDYRDDLSAKRFWYDGKTGTLLDVDHEMYSQVALPGNIDAAVDQLSKKYGLALPLADLISNDTFALIEKNAVAWGYIGIHDVDGTLAHHIAIMGETADLQLWIQKDGQPLPLKMVITYNRVPEAPQYEAVLMDWKLGVKVAADRFEPALPEGAGRIEFLAVEGGK